MKCLITLEHYAKVATNDYIPYMGNALRWGQQLNRNVGWISSEIRKRGEKLSNGFWKELLENYSIIVAGTGALLTISIFVFKRGIKPVWQALKKYQDTTDKIDRIFDEVMPNGGASMSDKVSVIGKNVEKIGYGLSIVTARQRAILQEESAGAIPRFETDLKGDCTWVNRAYARLVERTPAELLGHKWQNALDPNSREEVVTGWYKAVEEERELEINFNFKTISGKAIPCHVKSFIMDDPETGEILGYLGKITVL
jgi:PAS domain S-box-containing protein